MLASLPILLDSNMLTFRFGLNLDTHHDVLYCENEPSAKQRLGVIRQIEASLHSSLLVCRNSIRSKVYPVLTTVIYRPYQILILYLNYTSTFIPLYSSQYNSSHTEFSTSFITQSILDKQYFIWGLFYACPTKPSCSQ